jgi:DNA-binding CsgD family transcriptional regulator
VLKNKNIAVISSNCLLCLGLKNILDDFFTPESILTTASFDEYSQNKLAFHHDFIFLHSDLYVSHNEHFQGIKNKLIILSENEHNSLSQQSSLTILNVAQPQSELIDCLGKIFLSRTKNHLEDNLQELSPRETEVLKLVALGGINKQIADQLSISLHTVISHRKNITRKLGIKTVSGLSVYALLNGLISGTDLE